MSGLDSNLVRAAFLAKSSRMSIIIAHVQAGTDGADLGTVHVTHAHADYLSVDEIRECDE